MLGAGDKEPIGDNICTPILCSVLMPSDQDAWDVCRYLPMLTHEASHNFRYVPSRADRNRAAVRFIIERFCIQILRDIFSMIPESRFSIWYDRDLKFFSEALTEHLYEKFCRNKADIIENGRLDYLPSAIYSCFIHGSTLKLDGEMAFSTTAGPRDIICEAVRDLLQVSGIYFSSEYSSFCEKTRKTISHIICCKNKPIMVDETNEAVIELTGIVLERIRKEAMNHYVKTTKNNDSRRTYAYWNKIVGAAIESREKLDAIICDYAEINKDDRSYFEYLVELLYQINTDVNNIRYVSHLYQNVIPGNEEKNDFGKEVYGVLTRIVSETMCIKGYSMDRIRMTSKKMHAILIKLGLFNGDMQPDVFLSYFNELFNHWKSVEVIGALKEIIKGYREIFADLGMCAAFGFTEDGYRYYMEKNATLRPERIASEIMLERIETVCRILNSENTSKGDDDKYYRDVYEEYLKHEKSLWVKQVKMMKTVLDIGKYYNTRCDDEHVRKRIGNDFMHYYSMKYEERKTLYNNRKDMDPIEFLIGDTYE